MSFYLVLPIKKLLTYLYIGIYIVLSLVLSVKIGQSQAFLQHGSGTLFDSFEHPAQSVFIPDSSKKYAFNCFTPNIDLYADASGNMLKDIRTYLFEDTYKTDQLTIGQGQYNRAHLSGNIYWISFKIHANLQYHTEVGFAIQTRVHTNVRLSDELIAIADSRYQTLAPNAILHTNALNSKGHMMAYHQFSFAYRKNVDPQFAWGLKASLLSGIAYESGNISRSGLSIHAPKDIRIHIAGSRYKADQTIYTLFQHPGCSMSFGALYRLQNGIVLHGNLKDIGFIHWGSGAVRTKFSNSIRLTGTWDQNAIDDTIANKERPAWFNTMTNGELEIFANKTFLLKRDNDDWKYVPTFILSKSLFYDEYSVALTNRMQYKYLSLGLSSACKNNIVDVGLQLMIQSPNVECYIGMDRVFSSINIYKTLRKYGDKRYTYYTSNFFMGFSLKFGPLIAHLMNAGCPRF